MKLVHIIARRLVQLAALLLLLTAATFALSALIPGDYFTQQRMDSPMGEDTINRLRHAEGLDLPVHVQYLRWLGRFVQLDLGRSLFYGSPVSGVVGTAMQNTLWLGVPALLIGFPFGIVLGAFHGTTRSGRLARVLDTLSTVVLSMPSLVLGLLALLFAAQSRLLPLGGLNSVEMRDEVSVRWIVDRLHHLLLPAGCLVVPVIATLERIQHAASHSTTGQAHVTAARARGIPPFVVFLQYRLRPTLTPVLSSAGPVIASVLSGSLVLEVIFSWPGLGKVTYDALFNHDLPLLLGCVVAASALLVAANLLSDLLLAALDPRTETFEGDAW